MAEFSFVRHDQPDDSEVNPGITHDKIFLSGHYDIIICSTLRRCVETLRKSSITGNVVFEPLFRERYFSSRDKTEEEVSAGLLESETDIEFNYRAMCFVEKLKHFDIPGKKVLLVGHSYFFNYWYRKGCCQCPPFATLINLDHDKVFA